MKRITILVMVLVLAVFLGSGTSFAKKNGGCNEDNGNENRRKHKGIVQNILKCVKKVDVSDETQQIIRELMASHKEVMNEKHKEIRIAMKAYMNLFTAPELDEDALAEAQKKINSLKAELMDLQFEFANAIRNALTPEELAAVIACLKPEGSGSEFDNLLKCIKKADISNETQETIKKLIIANKMAMKEMMSHMGVAMKTYMEILTAPELDESALAEAQATINEITSEMLQLKFELTKAVREALTPDELTAVIDCLNGDASDDDNSDDDTGPVL